MKTRLQQEEKPSSADSTVDPLESARCARVNLDNLGRSVPGISAHPFFRIVAMQLDDAIAALEVHHG